MARAGLLCVFGGLLLCFVLMVFYHTDIESKQASIYQSSTDRKHSIGKHSIGKHVRNKPQKNIKLLTVKTKIRQRLASLDKSFHNKPNTVSGELNNLTSFNHILPQNSSLRHRGQTLPTNLESALAQYQKGVSKPSKQKLLSMHSREGRLIPYSKPSLGIEDIETIVVEESRNRGYVILRINVINNTTRRYVYGCNFEAKQYFLLVKARVAGCSVVDIFNGSYHVICQHGDMTCINVTVFLQFCNYEAFSFRPKYKPYNHLTIDKKYCQNSAKDFNARFISDTSVKPISWTLSDDRRKCEHLMDQGFSPVQLYTKQETCHCAARYDNIYIVSESHLRMIGDYLMQKCYGKNMTNIKALHHDLQHEKVHYYAWAVFKKLFVNIKKSLPNWLRTNRHFALWIQLGSWDFSHVGITHAMEIGLDYFNQTLTFIKSKIDQSNTKVDLRVVSTPPMPQNWLWNNFAIMAFVGKMQLIYESLKISYSSENRTISREIFT